MKIITHTLIKNEENFIWFAVNSILDYVDKILIWDTGSTDKTLEIVKSIRSPKIEFIEKGPQNPTDLVRLRDNMLKTSNSDWVFILDGDEIWSNEGITEIISLINKADDNKSLIVSPTKMLIGDIFHYQEEKGGKYQIADQSGHYNIRAIRRNIAGLHLEGIYPNEAYVDEKGIKIQNLPKEKMIFAKNYYLHASYLLRSSQSKSPAEQGQALPDKYKYEAGNLFPLDFYYPEVFFKPRPSVAPSPWRILTNKYKLRAFFETPFKKIKRRII